MSRQAVVIGSGVAGLAASIRLAHKGYQVTVCEANTYVGGKLSAFNVEGYRFDAGPSLFTLPHLVDELYTLCGHDARQHFQYERLDKLCRYQWPDGSTFVADAAPAQFIKDAASYFGEKEVHIHHHLRRAARIHAITSHVFLERSLHRLSTYLRPSTWLSILQLPRIDALRSMHSANSQQFRNPKLVQLFDRYATYNGSDPYRCPATLNVIPHLEYNLGAYFPAGGMVAITEALHQLALRMGVRFALNTRVLRILHQEGHVQGVLTDTGQLDAAIVVSNMDVTPTFRQLLPDLPAPEKILAQERSTSGIVFYWGIKRRFPSLLLHNIFFSQDYQAEFRQLFQDKTAPTDPSIYLNISCKHKPDDAPAGHENWFVMTNVPPDTGQDWDALVAATRQRVIGKLSAQLHTDVSALITCEAVLEPRIIQQRTSSAGGSLYGSASNSPLAAFFRHPNFSRQLKGLYFCGGSVHPGGGIPLCLLSAQIATDQVPNV